MWIERFVIVVIGLQRDFMPSAWGFYSPTIWDIGIYAGTIGLFLFMMFLFVRFLPMIPAFEISDLVAKLRPGEHHA
jgi:molybdopterin-containing oxidoreductase family membrane subunit